MRVIDFNRGVAGSTPAPATNFWPVRDEFSA
jgi:hypothetical protein